MAKEWKINRTGLVVLCSLGLCIMLFLVYTVRGVSYSDKTIKLSKLISASIHLAEQGGKKVVEVRKMDNDQIGQLLKGHTKEGKGEYVTFGDKESNRIIVSGLRALWPELQCQSEETDVVTADPKDIPSTFNSEVMHVAKRDEEVIVDEVTVWVDPLDATQEYTEGKSDLLNYVTVMVCIAVRGKPIAGIIHQPYIGKTKWAWVGHGVSKTLVEDTEPKPSNHNKEVRTIVSRSHPGSVLDVANNAFKDSGMSVKAIEAAGAGYKALQVAEHHADLYLHTTAINKWDVCAGNAILNAIGGKMTTLFGKELNYDIWGNPLNTEGIVAALTDEDHQEYLKRLGKDNPESL